MRKSRFIPVVAALLTWIALPALVGCGGGGSKGEAETTLGPSGTLAVETVPLDSQLVCMVNNAYMGKAQIPVEHEGKTYYGCCQMCVKKIQTEREVRYATDPATGEEVDKASAYIARSPDGSDQVHYFESADNYRKFISRRTRN